MNIIVTGSSGFIGSHICHYLSKKGFNCIPFSYKLLRNNSIKKISNEIIFHNPSYILHLSAYGNMSFQDDEEEMLYANYLDLWKLLQATKNINYTRFINFSSSSVYGRSKERMLEENRLRPDTLYAATKAGGEYLCRYFRKKYKKEIITVRPFSVYGEGEADFRFIPTLFRAARKGTIAKIILGSHDWIHIDDICTAVFKLLTAESLRHRTYNIGTGKETQNREIAEYIKEIVDPAQFEYELIDERKLQDSIIWKAGIHRISELNWSPHIDLYEGLTRFHRHAGTATT